MVSHFVPGCPLGNRRVWFDASCCNSRNSPCRRSRCRPAGTPPRSRRRRTRSRTSSMSPTRYDWRFGGLVFRELLWVGVWVGGVIILGDRSRPKGDRCPLGTFYFVSLSHACCMCPPMSSIRQPHTHINFPTLLISAAADQRQVCRCPVRQDVCHPGPPHGGGDLPRGRGRQGRRRRRDRRCARGL